MEFSTEGENIGSLLSDRKDSFNGFAFLHDFAITPNWAIFLQNAISFNPLPFLLGQKGAAQCLASKSDGTPKFLLIPRDSGKFAGQPPKSVEAPKGFVFHHLNAWEDDGKKLRFDGKVWEGFDRKIAWACCQIAIWWENGWKVYVSSMCFI